MLDIGGEGYGAPATKADLQALELRMTATLERRMNNLILHLAVFQMAVGGLIVAALKLLP